MPVFCTIPVERCFACGVSTTLRKKYLVLGEYVENFTCDPECEEQICDFYEAAELKEAVPCLSATCG